MRFYIKHHSFELDKLRLPTNDFAVNHKKNNLMISEFHGISTLRRKR